MHSVWSNPKKSVTSGSFTSWSPTATATGARPRRFSRLRQPKNQSPPWAAQTKHCLRYNRHSMIVLMAGLPGTGKTTLARELAHRTQGALLNKDEVRAALFSPEDIQYSVTQDDFVVEVMIQTARFLLQTNPTRKVFLDGRPFSRRNQIDRVLEFARELAQPWRIIECICSDESA